MNTTARFALFDRAEVKTTEVDGVTHIGDLDRDVVQEFGFIEPHDARTDDSSPCSVCGAPSVGDAGRRAGGVARPSTDQTNPGGAA